MLIEIDASGWQDEGEVWEAVLAALRAPDWHGRNLDALADSLSGGVNGVASPVTLVLRDVPVAVRPLVVRMAEVFGEMGSRLDNR